MHCLGKRLILPELLDTLPPDEAGASLMDLTRINRRWGGHSTLRKLLAGTVPASGRFSVLDVGAASGDMGACIRQSYAGAEVTSLDYVESHLTGASGAKVVADAFMQPFRPGSFDYVFCSLFLHHFTDEEVVERLRGFGEVARKAVLVIDLERNPIPYYFIAWSRPLLGCLRRSCSKNVCAPEARPGPSAATTCARLRDPGRRVDAARFPAARR